MQPAIRDECVQRRAPAARTKSCAWCRARARRRRRSRWPTRESRFRANANRQYAQSVHMTDDGDVEAVEVRVVEHARHQREEQRRHEPHGARPRPRSPDVDEPHAARREAHAAEAIARPLFGEEVPLLVEEGSTRCRTRSSRARGARGCSTRSRRPRPCEVAASASRKSSSNQSRVGDWPRGSRTPRRARNRCHAPSSPERRGKGWQEQRRSGGWSDSRPLGVFPSVGVAGWSIIGTRHSSQRRPACPSSGDPRGRTAAGPAFPRTVLAYERLFSLHSPRRRRAVSHGAAARTLWAAFACILASCGSSGHPPGMTDDVDGGAVANPTHMSTPCVDDAGVAPSPDAEGLCGQYFLSATGDAPNLYFVIDRSGSMGDMVEGRQKYDAVAGAAVDLVRSLGSKVKVGAAVFPGPHVDATHPCQVGEEVFATTLGDAVRGGSCDPDGPVTRAFSSSISLPDNAPPARRHSHRRDAQPHLARSRCLARSNRNRSCYRRWTQLQRNGQLRRIELHSQHRARSPRVHFRRELLQRSDRWSRRVQKLPR